VTDFQTWLSALIKERYGSKTELANALEISLQGLNKALEEGTMSTDNLLRLAVETGAPASLVFEKAGKGEISALIERLYGAAKPFRRPDVEEAARLLDQWSPQTVKHLIGLLEAPPPQNSSRSPRPAAPATSPAPPAPDTDSVPPSRLRPTRPPVSETSGRTPVRRPKGR
jgi:hypothetical protein